MTSYANLTLLASFEFVGHTRGFDLFWRWSGGVLGGEGTQKRRSPDAGNAFEYAWDERQDRCARSHADGEFSVCSASRSVDG